MMDPKTKEFHPIESPQEAKPGWPVFTVGEKFTLNGVEFYVRKITAKDVLLRPVR